MGDYPLRAGDPRTHVALRMQDALYVENSDTKEVSNCDLTKGPYALHHIAATLPADKLTALHDAPLANHSCAGAKACAAAKAMTP